MVQEHDARYTIGEFARLTGLTEKALRLYDRRELLLPAEVDPDTGYRLYTEDQIDSGRLVAMLRAIDMPLIEVADVLAASPTERSAAVGRYWYRIERDLDDYRQTVRALRGLNETREHGVSHTDFAIEEGRDTGAFAAIAALAEVEDLGEAANAYGEAMKAAYWTDKDIALVTAMAYAGVSRLLTAASSAEPDAAYQARSAAKGLMYDLASFSWVGWDEPGIQPSPAESAAGLAAARSNLAMAVDLNKGDLAISRAHWMLGAHLLTVGEHSAAVDSFDEAEDFAERAGAEAEAGLAASFGCLVGLAAGHDGASERLQAALERLASAEGGQEFVSQVETAQRVLGI